MEKWRKVAFRALTAEEQRVALRTASGAGMRQSPPPAVPATPEEARADFARMSRAC